MDSKKLNDWLQVAGLFGVVAGLIFVGLQLSLDRSVAVAERAREDTANRQYWAELLATNADVWIKGLAGNPLSATETAVFDALAASRMRLFFDGVTQGSRGISPAPQFYAAQAARLIHENPGLRKWWAEEGARSEDARQRAGMPVSNWRTAVDAELKRRDGEILGD